MSIVIILTLGSSTAVAIWVAVAFVPFGRMVREISSHLFGGVNQLFDPVLSDWEKEQAMRSAAKNVFLATLQFAGSLVGLLLLLSLGPLSLTVLTDLSFQQGTAYWISWEFLGFSLVLAILFAAVNKRVTDKTSDVRIDPRLNPYSGSAQFIHSAALSSWFVKFGAAIDPFFEKKNSSRDESPIFIIGIARSGSTALLNALHSVPEFGSYTYQSMPFITMPSVALRFFRGSASEEQSRAIPRAHGDGHFISLASPEAFEEIIWRAYFPHIYQDEHIAEIRGEDVDCKFVETFRQQVNSAALLDVRRKMRVFPEKFKYISKNNANIGRLELLKSFFKDPLFIIPVRDPIEHAGSLLRQHSRFSTLHASDPFSLLYMNDLGHYEFGANRKALSLDVPFSSKWSADNINFWVDYWIHAYSFLEIKCPDGLYVSLKMLIDNEQREMARVARYVGLQPNWNSNQSYFQSSIGGEQPQQKIDDKLAEQSAAIYGRLLSRCCTDG